MFASKVTKDVTLPSDPSITVTIRKLSWLQREDAENKAQYGMAKQLAAMGGVDAFQQYQQIVAGVSKDNTAPDAAASAVELSDVQQERSRLSHLMATHDALTVLVCGVVSWTATPAPSKDTLSDLGPEDASYLARVILALTIPPPPTETERKNDERGSTGT